jgi:hypothetical protein
MKTVMVIGGLHWQLTVIAGASDVSGDTQGRRRKQSRNSPRGKRDRIASLLALPAMTGVATDAASP